MIAGNEVIEEQSSILIIVGRQDTGDLEAQIRGSRHAWDIRLISVDALARLMLLKESVDAPRIIGRICNILIPREFTRLDEIVEIVFFTTEEAKQPVSFDEVEEDSGAEVENKPAVKPAAFHEACIERFSRQYHIKLIRRSRASFSTSDGSFAVICAVSKSHNLRGQISYWFAFHPYYKDFLEKSPNSFLVLGCGSGEHILAIPYSEVLTWLDDVWTTELEDRMYWHIRLQLDQDQFYLNRKKDRGRLNITQFLLSNSPAS